MTDAIPLTDVYVDESIVDAVCETLESTRYVKGPRVERFESAFADVCDTEHAVGVHSGTAALALSMRALGVGRGDDVLVPAHTFFASASPILTLGANPVFVDVDPRTHTIDPDELASKAETADDPVAVVAVHLYGQPAEMDAIRAVADDHDLAVIEDACQAHGGSYRGEPVGSLGDVGCFSFYPSKNMTVAGDGGMLVTDDDDIAREVRQLRNHGRDDEGTHVHVGLNWRMSEVSAAVGLEQLSHLADWNGQREAAADRYRDRLDGLDAIGLPEEREDARHVYHLFVVRAPDRDGLREYLDERGIQTGVHYDPPVHRTPAMRNALGETPSLPWTERLAGSVVSLPMHPRITDDEIDRVCDAIEEYYR